MEKILVQINTPIIAAKNSNVGLAGVLEIILPKIISTSTQWRPFSKNIPDLNF
jgi:hypothetical protein